MSLQMRPDHNRTRNWSDGSTSPGTRGVRVAGGHQKLREAWDRFSFGPSRRNQPRQHLDFRVPTSAAVVLSPPSPQFVVICYSS